MRKETKRCPDIEESEMNVARVGVVCPKRVVGRSRPSAVWWSGSNQSEGGVATSHWDDRNSRTK